MNAQCPAQGTGAYQFDWSQGRYTLNQDGLKAAMELVDRHQ